MNLRRPPWTRLLDLSANIDTDKTPTQRSVRNGGAGHYREPDPTPRFAAMRPASPRGAPRAAAPAAVALALLLVLVGAPLAAVAFCASEIYCTGPVLDTVQRAGVFNDSKYFVDSPTSKPVDQVLAAFAQLGQSPTVEAVRSFFDQNFLPAGSEVERVLPLDWSPQPAFLDKIRDPLLRKFALSLNTRWLKLVRTFNATAACEGCAVSSIPLKNPFVVAGGRFREAYYWDSVRHRPSFSLTICRLAGACDPQTLGADLTIRRQMYATAKGVIEDMLGTTESSLRASR
ncbi:MAG: Six-hairpin glycosidase-like protein [Olpidium bornovanus]|uniref:alpha,alpha-trehalase n=1 Tax=Olpidium bornovanus TaxID=278681 RepID=A0A8H7ZUR9_9FUNG|nr:MAG: Six-hairpin glycosidase-like protein [Olpidium bornovanus]